MFIKMDRTFSELLPFMMLLVFLIALAPHGAAFPIDANPLKCSPQTHEWISRTALVALGNFPESFLESVESQVEDPDREVGDDRLNHFDFDVDNPSEYPAGWAEEMQRVDLRRYQAVNALVAYECTGAGGLTDYLGHLFHLVQDHYSHTNWVDLYNGDWDECTWYQDCTYVPFIAEMGVGTPYTTCWATARGEAGFDSRDCPGSRYYQDALAMAVEATRREWRIIEEIVYTHYNTVDAANMFAYCGVRNLEFQGLFMGNVSWSPFMVGETGTIKWRYLGLPYDGTLEILLYRKGASGDELLGTITPPNQGAQLGGLQYPWQIGTYYDGNGQLVTLPTDDATEYQIKVHLLDIDGTWGSVDSENRYFKLGSLQLSSPSQSVNYLQHGEPFDLSWSYVGFNYTSYPVRLSLYQGSQLLGEILESDPECPAYPEATLAEGGYTWYVGEGIPDGPVCMPRQQRWSAGSDYRIVMKTTDDSTESAAFVIYDDMQVSDPPAGASWQMEESRTIRWSLQPASPSPAGKATLALYTSGANSVKIGNIADVWIGDGSYTWTVGHIACMQSTGAAGWLSEADLPAEYVIRIEGIALSNSHAGGSFTITASPADPLIKLSSPNGGESWDLGTTHAITWTGENLGNSIDIELWKNSSYLGAIAQGVANTGSYSWQVGTCSGCSVTPSGGYSVRIEDTASGTADVSNAAFTIAGAPELATMTSPTPGSTLNDSTVTFSWTAGQRVERYALWIGTGVNKHDIFDQDSNGALSLTVTNLPKDGSTLYVSLWSMIDGDWGNNVEHYTYQALTAVWAKMTSPANNSTFTSSTVTFTWTAGTGIERYALWIGTGVGKNDIYNKDSNGALSLTVTGLPQDGSTLYVSLWSMIDGSWGNNVRRYTYTAQIPVWAKMTSPANGSTFSSSTVTFKWTAGTGIERYALWIGTGVGKNDIYNKDSNGALSLTVSGLPQDGRTLYVSLWSMINGSWGNYVRRYTYTAQSPVWAAMTSPANNSTLSGSTTTFKWNAGVGIERYALWIGNSVGGNDIYNKDSNGALSLTVTNLPQDGRKLYVSLWSMVNGSWGNNVRRYTYTAQSPVWAAMTSPAPGSTLSGPSVTFKWNAGISIERYALWIGTSLGGNDIYNKDSNGALSLTPSNLPVDGRTLYVSLWSMVDGSWGNNVRRYTYTAASPVLAKLLQPANGSTLTSTTVTFKWDAGVGVERYALWIGSSLGQNDIYNMDSNGALQLTVSGLPRGSQTLYVSLWSMINGSWGNNVRRYTVKAAP